MARRIVTGNTNNGRSHVVCDGLAFEFGTLTEFWATESSPSDYGSDDEVVGRKVKPNRPRMARSSDFFG